MDFEACRFDFRLDAKNGLTPSKRKKSERRGTCYNTLFKCKVCGSLFDNRASLLEHKLIHNDHKCPICDVKVARRATLKEHLNVVHGLGKVKGDVEEARDAAGEKSALRDHIKVVRGLVRKTRGAKNQSMTHEQPAGLLTREQANAQALRELAPAVRHAAQRTSPSMPPMVSPSVPTAMQQPFPTVFSQPSSTQTSTSTGSPMAGYVYINVPVFMPGDKNNGNAVTMTTTQVPYSQGISTFPGMLPVGAAMHPLQEAKASSQPPHMQLDKSASSFVNVKREVEETPNPSNQTMTLPHFPAPTDLDELEPGEIRPIGRYANTTGLNSNLPSMGMQLPTMVKMEDFQKNQSPALPQVMTSQSGSFPQPIMTQPGPFTPNLCSPPPNSNLVGFIDGRGHIINIQPQPMLSGVHSDKVLDVSPHGHPYEQVDMSQRNYSAKSLYPHQVMVPEDDNDCVVDLSVDAVHSEAALAEDLSLGGHLPAIANPDYMEHSLNISEDGALDLSRKPSKYQESDSNKSNEVLSRSEQADGTGSESHNTSRPSSVASSTSELTSSKSVKKARSGGLNSMVARLWQTKIKEKTDDITQTVSLDQTLPGGNFTQAFPSVPKVDQPSTERKDDIIDHGDSTMSGDDEAPATTPVKEGSEGGQKREREEGPGEETPGSPEEPARKEPKPDYCVIKYHSCKVCRQLFESAQAMWEHVMQHEHFVNQKGDEPGEDDEPSEMAESLRSHTRSDGKIKQYPCKVCGKSLRSPAGLQVHMVRHDEAAERQYVCEHDTCQATFLSYRELQCHRSRCHKKTGRRYVCPRDGCNRDYVRLDSLRRHLMSHTQDRPLACNYPGCKKTFRESKHLKIHRLRHTDEKPMQCKLCDYACRQRNSMNWHMKSRHGLEKATTADNRTIYVNSDTVVIESFQFGSGVNTTGDSTVYAEEEIMQVNSAMAMEELETEDELEPSVPSSTDESCPEEGDGTESNSDNVAGEDEALNLTLPLRAEGFESDESGLSAVVASQPPQGESEPNFFTSVMKMKYRGFTRPSLPDNQSEAPTETKFHVCKICKQLFECAEKMWSHRLAEHDEICKFYCEQCGYNTDSRTDFDFHLMTSHGKEPTDAKEYVCTWCGKEYSSRHGLKQHSLMKHTEDGPPSYPCPYDKCDSKVQSKQALKQHIQRKHLKSQETNFPCPVEGCTRKFDNISTLRSHQMAHSEERPLVCDFPGCDKTFREGKHLKVHKMLHTDEKPLKCHLCYYSCRQRNSMNWHMKSKHGMQKQVSADGRTVYV